MRRCEARSDGVASAGALPAHALESRSIEKIDCRDVVIADRQPFPSGLNAMPERETSARRR